MLRFSEQKSYTVPVVVKTFDILELLRSSDHPLRIEEIAREAKVARTTTYRILRTLVQRGYAVQLLDGRYAFSSSRTIEERPHANTLKLQLHSASKEEEAIAIVFDLLQRSLSGNAQENEQRA